MEDNKIFVFLSHSHLDYEKVRVVRDLLENEGFRPLMFFLKCLEKKGYEELTRKLIKEEIDDRHRFVLCYSENAKESDWVQFEVDHIKETNRPYEFVDLNWPIEKIAKTIKRFKIRSTVFLSYPRKQKELAKAVNERLKMYDFNTFFDEDDLKAGDSYWETLEDNLTTAAKEGYVLAFLNDDFQSGCFQYKELKAAKDYHNRIIPVVSSQTSRLGRFLFSDIQWIYIEDMDIPEASDYIVDCLLIIDRQNNN